MSTESDTPPAKRRKFSSKISPETTGDILSIPAIPVLLFAFQNTMSLSLCGYRVPKINASNLTKSGICSQDRTLALRCSSMTSFLVGRLLSGTQKPHLQVKSILCRHPLNSELSGNCVDTMIGHRDNVNTCCASPSNEVLITCSNDGFVKFWKSPSQKNEPCDCASICVASLPHSSRVRSLAIHQTQPLMVTGDDSGKLTAWLLSPDHTSATHLATLEGHTGLILSVKYHQSRSIFVSTSSDGTSRLWHISPDLKTFDCLLVLFEPTGWVQSACFHPTNPTVLVTCNEDKTIKFWKLSPDFKSAKCTSILEGHTATILSIAFSEDGRFIASTSEDRTAKIWTPSSDGTSARCFATLEGHNGPVSDVAFHPVHPGIIATSSYDRTVKLWLLLDGSSSAKQVATLKGHLSCVLSVNFHKTNLITTTSSDRTAMTWK
jgi:WD40 repeat protein